MDTVCTPSKMYKYSCYAVQAVLEFTLHLPVYTKQNVQNKFLRVVLHLGLLILTLLIVRLFFVKLSYFVCYIKEGSEFAKDMYFWYLKYYPRVLYKYTNLKVA